MVTNQSLDGTVVKITDILLLKILAIASLKRKIDHKETIGLFLLKGLCHEMNNFLKAYYDKYVLPVQALIVFCSLLENEKIKLSL